MTKPLMLGIALASVLVAAVAIAVAVTVLICKSGTTDGGTPPPASRGYEYICGEVLDRDSYQSVAKCFLAALNAGERGQKELRSLADPATQSRNLRKLLNDTQKYTAGAKVQILEFYENFNPDHFESGDGGMIYRDTRRGMTFWFLLLKTADGWRVSACN